jgi:hypothetical protein
MLDARTLDSLLTTGSAASVASLGPVEVLAAVHTHDQERHVARVLAAVAAGLAKTDGPQRALLVADGGSRDATRDAVEAWVRTSPLPGRVLQFIRPASRGSAILGLLAVARAMGARACALVSADLAGFPSEWMPSLLEPVVSAQADYVSPAYSRAPSEGTLTTNVLAPLTHALYATRVQQVAPGCVGLGAGLIERWIAGASGMDGWSPEGLEMALTTEALASGARVAEVQLGVRPVDTSAPQPDLSTTLVRTVGPLFRLIERHHAAWRDGRRSVPLPRLGVAPPVPAVPGGPLRVERMVNAFRLGLKDLLPVWEQILPDETLAQLYPLGLLGPDEFHFSPSLWARVVSDFAVTHHDERLPRDHLLRALTPLYLGRVAAFLLEVRAHPAAPAAVLDAIDRAFEAEKDYLVARWR